MWRVSLSMPATEQEKKMCLTSNQNYFEIQPQNPFLIPQSLESDFPRNVNVLRIETSLS